MLMQDIVRFFSDIYENLMHNQWIQNHSLQFNAILWAVAICLIYGIGIFIWNTIEGMDHHPKRFWGGTIIIIIATFFLSTPIIAWFNRLSEFMKLLIGLGGIILTIVVWGLVKGYFSNKDWTP